MNEPNWGDLFDNILKRYLELGPNSERRLSFIRHVENLSQWESDISDIEEEFIVPLLIFPPEIYVSLASCHPNCGTQEFIVDGSTQECQRCGRLMFRFESRKYQKSGDEGTD